MGAQNKKSTFSLSILICGILFSFQSIGYGQLEEKEKFTFADTGIVNGYQLCSFTVKCVEGKAYATWVIIETDENSLYTLERSEDNITFQPLHTKRSAKSPNNIKLMHCFIDQKPLQGVSYYRIKRLTTEATTTSEIVTINNIVSDTKISEEVSIVSTNKK